MKHKGSFEQHTGKDLVVARASPSTWVVAISRRLIPGACFRTRRAAVRYASLLASLGGFGRDQVRILT